MRKDYGVLYKKYFLINIKSIMVYDLDYLLGIIAMILKSGVNFCMLLLLFQLVDEVNGWTFDEMLFLYGIGTVSYSLWHCFFIDIITIPTYIQTGELDRFLLKPVDPLFQIMMEAFDEDGWGELIFGIIVLIMSIVRLDIISPKLIVLPFFCISGCLIFAAITIFFSSIAFYTIGNVDMTDNVMDFREVIKYPLNIYNNFIQILFTFFIPIAFIAYYPGLWYLDKKVDMSLNMMFFGIPVSILFFSLAWIWWHHALKKYSSSGQ